MKKILLYIIALLPLMAFAQEPQQFLIKAKVGNLNAPARAYLIYQLGANRVIDSALITNGSFIFKGQIINPSAAVLVIDRNGAGLNSLDTSADNLNFYVDKGEFEINSKDSIAKAVIKGSKIND